jgi:hypothetical protein
VSVDSLNGNYGSDYTGPQNPHNSFDDGPDDYSMRCSNCNKRTYYDPEDPEEVKWAYKLTGDVLIMKEKEHDYKTKRKKHGWWIGESKLWSGGYL